MVYFGAHLRYSDLGGGYPPVLPTSHRIWTNPTIGPWDKWGGRVPPSPPPWLCHWVSDHIIDINRQWVLSVRTETKKTLAILHCRETLRRRQEQSAERTVQVVERRPVRRETTSQSLRNRSADGFPLGSL